MNEQQHGHYGDDFHLEFFDRAGEQPTVSVSWWIALNLPSRSPHRTGRT
jgi:hypothetical protein